MSSFRASVGGRVDGRLGAPCDMASVSTDLMPPALCSPPSVIGPIPLRHQWAESQPSLVSSGKLGPAM